MDNKIVVSENKNSNPRKGESNMDYIIETENLTKRYGTATVVDKVNLHVPKGKIYGLLGRNGAGKTTAMKMMLQLAFPTEGTVRLFGTNYKENIHTLYSKVGSIIETPGFYSNLTGYENLQILAKLRGGVSKSGVEKALEVVGLHKEKRKVFSDYSLGMKQRLGIAAAIMHEPELLIIMGFNYGYEKKKFDSRWKRLEVEYCDAGMSEEQIAAMKEYDWAWFCSQRVFQNHTPPI